MPSLRGASQVASGTAASFSCTKPTSTAQGDVLVAFHGADAGTLAELGTPTGGATWTLLASRARDDGTGAGSKVWWKVAGASEPSTYGFTQNSGADGAVSIVAVQNGSTNTPVVAQTGGITSGTSKATPSTTPNGSDDFEIRCVLLHAPGASGLTCTPPSGYTEQTDVESQQYALCSTATKALTSNAATGTQNFTISASVSEWHGFTVDIGSASTAISLSETAVGSDDLTVAADAPLAETSTANDTLTADATTALTDTVTVDDALTVAVFVDLTDAAVGVDGIAVAMPVDLTDTVTAVDDLSAVPAPVLDEPIAGTDTLSVSATATLTEAVTATDALTVVDLVPKALSDTVTVNDSLTVVILEDRTFVAGPLRRGWGSRDPDHAWGSGAPKRGWTARTLTA